MLGIQRELSVKKFNGQRLIKIIVVVLIGMFFSLSYIISKGWFFNWKSELGMVLLICFLGAVIISNFLGKSEALFSHIVLYIVLTNIIVNTSLFSDVGGMAVKTKGTLIVFLLTYFSLILNTMAIAFKFTRMPSKVNKRQRLFDAIDIYGSLIFLMVLYIILVLFTVLLFAGIYETFINNGGGVEGLYYSSTLDGIPMKVGPWDPLYFSSSTFFTVGYGDILPVGIVTKFLVQSEMLVGHFINIALPALVFNLIINKFSKYQEVE